MKEENKMKKKYLKTIEDIEALRNTDTKIYREYQSSIGYYKFVNGVLCSFTTIDELFMYNAGLSWNIQEYYIKVEDEPSEDLIGKLGWFWDDDEDVKCVDVLNDISTGNGRFEGQTDGWYDHFRPLTPEEIEKYTGYKVVKEK